MLNFTSSMRNCGLAGLAFLTTAISVGLGAESDPFYIVPTEDILITTPAPKERIWAQQSQSYPLIGLANTGYLIVYTDSSGKPQAGMAPFRDRLNNITASASDYAITTRPNAVVEITQGGILLLKDHPYRLMNEAVGKVTLFYTCGPLTQNVTIAKSRIRITTIHQPATKPVKGPQQEEMVMVNGQWFPARLVAGTADQQEERRLKAAQSLLHASAVEGERNVDKQQLNSSATLSGWHGTAGPGARRRGSGDQQQGGN